MYEKYWKSLSFKRIKKRYLREARFVLMEIGGTGNVKINVAFSDYLFGEIFYSRSLAIYNLNENKEEKIIKKAHNKLESIIDDWKK